MRFAIEFVPEPQTSDEPTLDRAGRLVLGDFEEQFFANMEYWRELDYERQWIEGLERILTGATTSCLITSIGRPEASGGLWWWTLYRSGNRIHVQNAMCFYASLREPFDPSNPYAAVPPRRVATEDGDPISEWIITVGDIAQFVGSMQQ